MAASDRDFEPVDVPDYTPVTIVIHGRIHSQTEWEAWDELVQNVERAAGDRRLASLNMVVE